MRKRSTKNRTITCSDQEQRRLRQSLLSLDAPLDLPALQGKIINQDLLSTVRHLPLACIDLLVMDPPYNLSKTYHGYSFKEQEHDHYQAWFISVLRLIKPLLKPTATLYVCADWKTSLLVAPLLEQEFYIQNRITWEREKGRGAQKNWKNNAEDIWFCTVSKTYTFNIEAVKQKRRVLAPYRHKTGQPKDWIAEEKGKFRLTYPSNLWTDISIPFWSMPENTDHPTQKPEKLIAKLVLASSNPGDMILDPFLGSGTTAVVAKKLQRNFIGIELNPEYCCWALKRLQLAEDNPSIQGFTDGIFWERNTQYSKSPKNKKKPPPVSEGKL